MKNRMRWIGSGVGLMCLIALAGLTASPALAGTMPMFTECPAVGQDTGCQVLITINAGGSLSFQTDAGQPSYDPSGDDTLVGVLNSSGVPQQSISLTGSDIFDFDFDGACGGPGTFTPEPPGCSGPLLGFNAPTSYEGYDLNGNFDSFTVYSLDSGTIIFANQLGVNDSAFFSLQGAPGDINGVASRATPEPASIFLLGTGLLALFLISRKSLTFVN